jgi:hypothetical protein
MKPTIGIIKGIVERKTLTTVRVLTRSSCLIAHVAYLDVLILQKNRFQVKPV